MNKQLLLICLTLLTLSSCKKSLLTGGEDCNALNNLHITSNTPVPIGGNIKFSVPEVGGYRIYSWRGPNNYTSQETGDSITYAELKYEGWYYVHISKPDCNNSYTDSVYIDVKLNQGTPSCTETANTCRYNNLFDDNFSSVSREINSSTGYLSIDATAFGSGEMTIFFHPEWLTKEPEDGIYTTTNVPSFEQLDANYNKVFISAIKQSIYFACHQNQQVYISHVNGKLQVRFCSLVMSGSNGSSSFVTNASGNVIAQ